MIFSFNLSPIIIALIAATLLCVIFLLTAYRKRVASIHRFQSRNLPNTDDLTSASLPTASVIIYTNDEASELARLLPIILEQDYPTAFEVIVVNDGASEAINDIVSELRQSHSNLYLTYTPNEARNLSRKKLALTLGIKAARNEVVVLTNADAVITSRQWLSHLCRHFNPSTEVVIAHACNNVHRDKTIGKRRRAFDSAISDVAHLSAAIFHHPYRGNSYNLAYRRDTFFKNKGFSHSLNLHHGDDDIFINRITNSHNTAVELSPEAIVACDFYNPRSMHREMKSRRIFNARFLRKGTPRFFGFCSFIFWLWLILSVATIALSLPNLFPSAIIGGLALALWVPLIFTWRKTLKALQSRRLALSLPYLILTQPFYNLFYRISGKRHRYRNYTWHQK